MTYDDTIEWKEELRYWQLIEQIYPWELMSWSYKQTATFRDSSGVTLRLTGNMRDDIVLGRKKR